MNLNCLKQPSVHQEQQSLWPISVKRGRIVFNRHANDLLAGNTHCFLAYDFNSKVIGIKTTAEKEQHTFDIKPTQKGSYIAAKKFIHDFACLGPLFEEQVRIKITPQVTEDNYIVLALAQ